MPIKKKKPIKGEVNTAFKIPQISASFEGLLKTKRGFQKTPIGSALFGSNVKDEIHVIDNAGKVNVDTAYESFRKPDDRHFSDEDLIKKHGTKFFEFQRITDETKEEIFGIKSKKNEVIPEENVLPFHENKPFSFVEEKSDFINGNNYEDDGRYSVPEKHEEYNLGSDEFNLGFKINEEYANMQFRPEFESNDLDEVEKEEEEIAPMEDMSAPDIPYERENFGFKFNSIEPEIRKGYLLPPISGFLKTVSHTNEIPEWLTAKKDIINQTLLDFDISGDVVNYTKGPAFTRYEIMLQAGVKVNKVTNIYDNLQMSLGARSIRILAPIPGKKTVGIEVPNDKTEKVLFGDVVSDDFINNKSKLTVTLGKNIDGKIVYRDLAEMPHCLIGGATKSGKSVCINSIIISLLLKNKPSELKFILIDPKAVELRFYDDIPHLVTPVITDAKMASESLKWAVEEMERRYTALSENRIRNIEDYNLKADRNPDLKLAKMPYIVIVIDEFADLMMASASDVEDSIQRLTQKARAAGIHLILATQRPVVEFVKGSIKANIPTRIAFKVSSFIDSNTILDEGGAENLLGKGDMLIKDTTIPERLQGAYISDDEINAVCDYIRTEELPNYLFTHEDLKKNMVLGASVTISNSSAETDETLYNVALFCIESGSCSINSIQLKFNFGFNRAQKIVIMLEERQIVSPKKGTKGREILLDAPKLRQMFNRVD